MTHIAIRVDVRLSHFSSFMRNHCQPFSEMMFRLKFDAVPYEMRRLLVEQDATKKGLWKIIQIQVAGIRLSSRLVFQ